MNQNKMEAVRNTIEEMKARSAWDKGVKLYAVELLDEIDERSAWEGHEPQNVEELVDYMLNGAKDWQHPTSERRAWVVYSEGGSALIYDGDICERLCTETEKKRTKNGEKDPNPRETWLQVQARALFQAATRIRYAYRAAEKEV